MNEYIYLCETQSRIIKVLEAENTELRELVLDMWHEIMTCPYYHYPLLLTTNIYERVRELKVIE